MGIIGKIKALFAVRKLIKEAGQMDGTKPGWQTTEFWGKTLIQIVVLYNALSAKDIPIETATAIVAALEGIYVAGRSVVKAIKDVVVLWKKPAEKPA